MFPPKSLGLVLATCVYAAAARQSLSNLYDDCEFIVDQSRYDLCPLFHNSGRDGVVRVHAELAPAVQISYEISFGGPVSPQNGDSERDELQVRAADASIQRFTNESELIAVSVSSRHMGLFKRQVFAFVYR